MCLNHPEAIPSLCQSVEKLSSMKLAPGASEFEDHRLSTCSSQKASGGAALWGSFQWGRGEGGGSLVVQVQL